MSQDNDRPDPEDMFAHTRMSLGDHIEELRTCLFRAGKGFLIAMVIGFFIAAWVLEVIKYPVQSQLERFYDEQVREATRPGAGEADSDAARRARQAQRTLWVDRNQLRDLVGMPTEKEEAETIFWGFQLRKRHWVPIEMKYDPRDITNDVAPLMQPIIRPPHLSVLSITESFIVWCKVAIYCGIVLASPWIFWQLWSFVAAGLYPHEKKYVFTFLPFSIILFLGGVTLCQLIVLPKGVEYLLYFTKWLRMEPDLRLSEWLSFAIMMPLIMGIAFQLPLVMYALYKVGVFEVETYQGNWRIALFLMTFIGFFIAPSPDPFSGICMATPLWLLYFVGIWMCKMWPNPKFEMEESEGEMVEV